MDREALPAEQSVPRSDGTDGDVLSTLLRYRDRRRWSWNLSARLINLYYGTHYTEKQLSAMYKTHGGKN